MMTRISLALALVFVTGCPVGGFRDPNEEIDRDGDNVSADEDCDDRDEDIGREREFFADADQDSFGNADMSVKGCEAPDGFVRNNDDCNDLEATVKPGGIEICNGLDDDCDGNIDSADAELVGGYTYFFDEDGDGYGDDQVFTRSCNKSLSGYSLQNGDCEDDIAAINPGMTEESEATCSNGIDDDCNGAEDEDDSPNCDAYVDLDDDGQSENQGDCDDDDEDINSNVVENNVLLCFNGVDDDCDELVDVAKDPGCAPYIDADKDTWPASLDCDDKDPTRNPGEIELCYDAKDTDCDGNSSSSESDCFNVDADGDGSAPPADCKDDNKLINPSAAEVPDNGIDENCDGADGKSVNIDDDGDGFTESAGDCNDADKAVNPSVAEGPSNGTCNDSKDNDCDGKADLNEISCQPPADADGDGATVTVDCNDADKAISPGATENCTNGVDDNCNGAKDAADTDCKTSSPDADADGYPQSVDCNDGSKFVNPGTAENCTNGVDDNCNGILDAADTDCKVTSGVDADSDGYLVSVDCKDDNKAINPGVTEQCTDAIDNNCNGLVDSKDSACGSSSGTDLDGDGYLSSVDCNDGSKSINPGATEVCTGGVDENCNGKTDAADTACGAPPSGSDADGDGYTTALDCNDSNKAVYPGAVDVCGDALDSDCDTHSYSCVGTITCVDNGSNQRVTITGDVTRGVCHADDQLSCAPFPTTKVYLHGADGSETGLNYVNVTTPIVFNAFGEVDFIPYATQGTALNPDATSLPSVWFSLQLWNISGACALALDPGSTFSEDMKVDYLP